MLKRTEIEEPIGFFCHIFIISGIAIGGGGRPQAPAPPSGYAYAPWSFF